MQRKHWARVMAVRESPKNCVTVGEAANKAFDCNIVAFFHKAISTSSFTASGFGPCHTTPVVSRSILSYCHVHVNRCTKKKK